MDAFVLNSMGVHGRNFSRRETRPCLACKRPPWLHNEDGLGDREVVGTEAEKGDQTLLFSSWQGRSSYLGPGAAGGDREEPMNLRECWEIETTPL